MNHLVFIPPTSYLERILIANLSIILDWSRQSGAIKNPLLLSGVIR